MCVKNKLSEADMNLIKKYVKCATGVEMYSNLEEYFTPWFNAKSMYLFDIFKDNLIIDCGMVDYEMSTEELEEDNSIIVSKDFRITKEACRETLVDLIKEVIFPNGNDKMPTELYRKAYFCLTENEKKEYIDYTHRHNFITCTNQLFENENLINNRVRLAISCKLCEESKYKLTLVKNARIFRTIENILKTIEKAFPNVYSSKIDVINKNLEELRILISQVLNTRRIKGHLKLSIHPLDYLTMSDNDLDWKSCMALYHPDENYNIGCYSAGTIATMNSPCTIVAYLESETPFNLYGTGEWSNKKWRQLVVIDEKFIANIKGYPYFNSSLNAIVLNKIKSLVKETKGWEYTENKTRNSECLVTNYKFEDDSNFIYYLVTGIMYNDAECSSNLYCLSTKINDFIKESGKKWENYYYDAAAFCLNCNAFIEEAGLPFCYDCSPITRCEDCGCAIDEESTYHDEEGRDLCYNCYYNSHRECDVCGETHLLVNSYDITVFDPAKDEYTGSPIYIMIYKERANGSIEYKELFVEDWVCPDCIKKCIEKGFINPAHYDFNNESWTNFGEGYFLTEKAMNNTDELADFGIDVQFIKLDYLSRGWTFVNAASLAPNIDFLKKL